MSDSKKIIKDLEKFGLDKNQGEIYLFLIRNGEARIQEISLRTQIPRSSVYEALKQLQILGLIENIVQHKFVKIRPYPIGSLRHKLNEKMVDIQGLITDLSDLENEFKFLPKDLTPTTVRYYKDISGARQLFWNSLNAKNTVYVYSEYGRPSYVGKSFYSDFVRESRERNVQEKVLINLTTRVRELLKIYLGKSDTRTKLGDIRVIADENVLIKGETFIYDNVYAQAYIYSDEINGFEIENNQFIQTQRSIFETLWKTAKPLSDLV